MEITLQNLYNQGYFLEALLHFKNIYQEQEKNAILERCMHLFISAYCKLCLKQQTEESIDIEFEDIERQVVAEFQENICNIGYLEQLEEEFGEGVQQNFQKRFFKRLNKKLSELYNIKEQADKFLNILHECHSINFIKFLLPAGPTFIEAQRIKIIQNRIFTACIKSSCKEQELRLIPRIKLSHNWALAARIDSEADDDALVRNLIASCPTTGSGDLAISVGEGIVGEKVYRILKTIKAAKESGLLPNVNTTIFTGKSSDKSLAHSLLITRKILQEEPNDFFWNNIRENSSFFDGAGFACGDSVQQIKEKALITKNRNFLEMLLLNLSKNFVVDEKSIVVVSDKNPPIQFNNHLAQQVLFGKSGLILFDTRPDRENTAEYCVPVELKNWVVCKTVGFNTTMPLELKHSGDAYANPRFNDFANYYKEFFSVEQQFLCAQEKLTRKTAPDVFEFLDAKDIGEMPCLMNQDWRAWDYAKLKTALESVQESLEYQEEKDFLDAMLRHNGTSVRLINFLEKLGVQKKLQLQKLFESSSISLNCFVPLNVSDGLTQKTLYNLLEILAPKSSEPQRNAIASIYTREQILIGDPSVLGIMLDPEIQTNLRVVRGDEVKISYPNHQARQMWAEYFSFLDDVDSYVVIPKFFKSSREFFDFWELERGRRGETQAIKDTAYYLCESTNEMHKRLHIQLLFSKLESEELLSIELLQQLQKKLASARFSTQCMFEAKFFNLIQGKILITFDLSERFEIARAVESLPCETKKEALRNEYYKQRQEKGLNNDVEIEKLKQLLRSNGIIAKNLVSPRPIIITPAAKTIFKKQRLSSDNLSKGFAADGRDYRRRDCCFRH